MFTPPVVVDGNGHLLGRLASVVAKELLSGQQVVIVRCEDVNMTGKPIRNQLKYLSYLRKRHLSKPSRGQFHYRAPARMVWRTIRGMLPLRTDKGNKALARLKVFEGVPVPYDKMKRQVIPAALRDLRLAPQRKYTALKQISNQVGWKYGPVIEKLEAQRKMKSDSWYQANKTLRNLRAKATEQALNEVPEDLRKIVESF
ncbi:hypothetical protein GEMRC1_013301 [Eukaryota sp. GEM-RC1]